MANQIVVSSGAAAIDIKFVIPNNGSSTAAALTAFL